MKQFVPLTPASAVPLNRGITVRHGQHLIAVFNQDGEFFATEGTCPHRGAPLGQGTLAEGAVACPFHGWQFDLKTGACRDKPDKPIHTYPVRVIDGQVQIQL